MNDRNNQLKKYYRSIKSWLPGSAKQNKLILTKIQEDIVAYAEENPDAGADEIEQRFGTPQQIAAACVDEMGMEELLHRLRVRKKVLGVIRNACLCMLAVLVLLAVLTIPRVDYSQHVPVASMEKYPVLLDAYDSFCYQYRDFTTETEETIQILKVKNIWGSWECYILPCFAVQTATVPRYGSTTYTSSMYVLSAWSEENLFTKMVSLTLDVNPHMHPGRYALASEELDVLPITAQVINGVVCIDGLKCDETPGFFVHYTVGTSGNVEVPEGPQECQAMFRWNYTLLIHGVRISAGEFIMERPVIVNA